MKLKNLLLIPALFLLIALSACVSKTSQMFDKSTVFGFQAVSPGPSGSNIKIQIGLVRNEYWSNPTSTNKIYAAQYSSHVDAKLSALSQSAKEDFSTLPQTVNDNENATNTGINVITTSVTLDPNK